jgi:hypothetical protein
MISTPTISTSMRSAEKISFLTPNPPTGGEERDSDKRTMGWGYGSSPLDLDGAEKTPIRKSKKFSLQDLYPPGRRGTGLRRKDDGGRDVSAKKIIAAGPLPPPSGHFGGPVFPRNEHPWLENHAVLTLVQAPGC